MTKEPLRLRLVRPAGAAILLLLLAAFVRGHSTAFALDNLVRVDPSGVEVAPNGTFHVSVVDDPPAASTAVWAIDLVYDPAVVSTSNTDCDPINTPPGAIGAFDCEVVDADKDGTNETVKIIGAVLFTGSKTGLTKESVLADIAFHTIGGAGSCSDLHLRIRSHADKDGKETGALVQDGRVCVEGSAPPVGTASENPVTPRTSEPTPVPTLPGSSATITPAPQGSQESTAPGQTAPSGASGGSTSSAGHTGASGTATIPPSAGGNVEEDNGGGTSPVVWVVVGGIILVLAAAGAWSIVRLRKPPAPE